LSFNIGIDARKLTDFGIGTYIENLVRHLGEIDQNNRYFLLVNSPSSSTLRDLPDNFECVQVNSPVYSVRELLGLSWKLSRLKLDLYHATHYVLPLFVPCRVVVTIHDIIHLLYPEFLPNRFALTYAKRMIRHSLERGDRVIAVSKNTKSDLMKYFDTNGAKIQVIYSGVSDAFREHVTEVDAATCRRRLNLEKPYLLFVGNPKPHKNLDNVVKAFARAIQIHEFGARLVCVGGRPGTESKIRQRADLLGISDRLVWLGHVDSQDLPAIYQEASVLLYPTLYEGFGLPVIEAMASGTPVITSNSSALKEVGEGFAQLVDPLNIEEMARAIVQVMTEPDHSSRLAQLGLERADDFQWGKTADETLQVYQEVLKPSATSPASEFERNSP
jgi:glycosyltransferase involved in cell wall biosynthesis